MQPAQGRAPYKQNAKRDMYAPSIRNLAQQSRHKVWECKRGSGLYDFVHASVIAQQRVRGSYATVKDGF